MTKDELSEYIALQSESRRLRTMLAREHLAAVGGDTRSIKLMKERLKKCEDQIYKVEKWIDDIPESETRQIFTMRYIEGKKLREIAEQMKYERSTVGNKIENYCRKC